MNVCSVATNITRCPESSQVAFTRLSGMLPPSLSGHVSLSMSAPPQLEGFHAGTPSLLQTLGVFAVDMVVKHAMEVMMFLQDLQGTQCVVSKCLVITHVPWLYVAQVVAPSSEPCQILLCKKRSYKLAFADPFVMLSRPHVLLSRALVSLELLSRRFRGGPSNSMQAFAGLSRRDLLWLLSR